ncbi:MAG: hypothetical protein ACR2PT_14335 [Endozoicomonas sp.]
MNELKLRLVTTGSLDSLEKMLHSSSEEGLRVRHFSAEHKPERGHYEVLICVTGYTSRDQLIMRLASEESIRELTPVRR